MGHKVMTKAILFLCVYEGLINSNTQVARDIAQHCKDNCACCKNQNCGPTGYFKEGNCYDGCIDGYRGARCYIKCTYNCTKCQDHKDQCTECYDGYFPGPNRNCLAKCPKGCERCTSNDTCIKCKKEYVNNNGSTDKCHVMSHECRDNCKRCSAYNTCLQCKTGRYGSTCQEACSFGCETNECQIDSGNCKCSPNFSGDKCDQCQTGRYGTRCEKQCSSTCKGKLCDKESGRCLGGCIMDTIIDNCVNSCDFETGSCDSCKKNFYGFFCNLSCSSICIDGLCNQDNGKCSRGCKGASDDPVCPLRPEKGSSDPVNVTGPVVGCIVCLAITAGVIAAVWFYRRRICQFISRLKSEEKGIRGNAEVAEYERNEEHTYGNITGKERKQIISVKNASAVVDIDDEQTDERVDDSATKTDDTYYNMEQNNHRVNVDNLLKYVTKEHFDSFENEFKKLNNGLDLKEICSFARKPENVALNRYNGIYPYNHSRVTVPGQPAFYINACYIDGYNKRKAYIASSGPTAKTTDTFSTFWSMVWNEKSDIIVMLTNLNEPSGKKCEKYWPESEREELYGQVKVKCLSIEKYAENTVRTFTVAKGKEERNVLQLHYTAWPDKSVPLEVTSLVEFRQRVKAVPVSLGGPVIVHCSAGVGRTGTYIALDQLTEEGSSVGSVDVFNCVNKMRQQRVNMVQTAEQYTFLHKSLVHSLSFGCEALTAEQIQGIMNATDDKMFTKVYQTLRQEVDIESKEDIETRGENQKKYKNKNRRQSDIPGGSSRVRLYLSRKDGKHDYINAVFINSFRIKNLFIAAQSPLPGTVEDFLSMIYQQNSTCVVALEESHNQPNDVGPYLPADNEPFKFGNFTVMSSKCETKPQYDMKKLSIRNEKGEEKTVSHFQYKNWGHSKKVPDSAEKFVQFIKEVENCIHRQTEDTPNIVVHCLNGYKRSGLFCVVYKLLEKLEAERQVSVVNIVRKVRTHRKQSITSVEQLKFCYHCVVAYMEIYNTYTNFAT